MAKLQMKGITIACMRSDRPALMGFLQRRGVVELKKPRMVERFTFEDTSSQRAAYTRTAQIAQQALDLLDRTAPEKSSIFAALNGRTVLDEQEYIARQEQAAKTMEFCYDLVELERQQNQCRAEVERITVLLDTLRPYLPLDVPMMTRGTRYTTIWIGTVEGIYTQQALRERIGDGYPYALEIISTGEKQTCIVAVCLKTDEPALRQTLQALGFAAAPHDGRQITVKEQVQLLQSRKDALEQDERIIRSLIVGFADRRADIQFAVDFYTMRADRYAAYGQQLQSRNTLVVDGYIPAAHAAALKEELERRFAAAVQLRDPEPDEDLPVLLHNNGFARPCEGIVNMYSPPGKGDIDPTGVMALFFYLFFGLMLSDAGYGLLVTLACAVALLKFHPEEGLKNNLKLFLLGGISTIFWGVLFGSYFGDLLQQISGNFFGHAIIVKPVWLNPLEQPLTLLIFGLALGVVHIYTGMTIRLISLCKSGKVLDALFDVGLWMVTIAALLLLLTGTAMDMSPLIAVGAWVAVGGAAGLILTQGRHKKGIGKVISGIASLYDITSYASDILSYSRLMALGLATGVLAQVVNMLGTMSDGVVGVLIFIVVFLFGTTISLAMNALGAYVHTIRLQYVEFFSKFYQGGGRLFKPFAAKTRYFRFKK